MFKLNRKFPLLGFDGVFFFFPLLFGFEQTENYDKLFSYELDAKINKKNLNLSSSVKTKSLKKKVSSKKSSSSTSSASINGISIDAGGGGDDGGGGGGPKSISTSNVDLKLSTVTITPSRTKSAKSSNWSKFKSRLVVLLMAYFPL